MIRKMNAQDIPSLKAMMTVFYASDAVSTNGSEEIFENDIRFCVQGDPYVEGYVFEEAGALQGYAMLAKSYSTEFGKHCVWIEDLYIKEEYRGLGLAGKFLDFVSGQYPSCLLRLEAEANNERALHVYKRAGFVPLDYVEMVKQR